MDLSRYRLGGLNTYMFPPHMLTFSGICSGNKRFELLGDAKIWLVVFSHPSEKYAQVKLEIFPNFRGGNKKCLKPPPRNCLSFGVSNMWVLKPMGIGDRTSVLHKVIIREKTWLLMGGGASQVKSYVYIYMQYTYIHAIYIYILYYSKIILYYIILYYIYLCSTSYMGVSQTWGYAKLGSLLFRKPAHPKTMEVNQKWKKSLGNELQQHAKLPYSREKKTFVSSVGSSRDEKCQFCDKNCVL